MLEWERQRAAFSLDHSSAVRPAESVTDGIPSRRLDLYPEERALNLAIFDLDNTLLAGDSDHAWGQFLVDRGIVDPEVYRQANDRFYQEYLSGQLDIGRYLEFALQPLTQYSVEQLERWREEFVDARIRPMLHRPALDLLSDHRNLGHVLLIITATNQFVTDPIARLLGVDDLIATVPEQLDGRYTGRVAGIPSFREGKVERLRDWLNAQDKPAQRTWFYSDSHNDLPLLEQVDHPVAVDPDPHLEKTARARNWPVISLREPRAG